jgi:hypothetical protein
MTLPQNMQKVNTHMHFVDIFPYYTYCLKKRNDIGCLYLQSRVKKKTPDRQYNNQKNGYFTAWIPLSVKGLSNILPYTCLDERQEKLPI